VAGRFPLFFDACVRQQIIDGLARRYWDVQRAIDFFPEKTPDDVLFEYAAANNRVFVTNDARIQGTGESWLKNGRPFTGLIFWPRKHYQRMTDGDIIRKIEERAEMDNPFAYPIVRIKPDK
jgi:Domain of unknown function (DUF5615)